MQDVAVTGMGLVTPLGIGRAVNLDAIRSGSSAIRRLAGSEAGAASVYFGAEAPALPVNELVRNKKALRQMSPEAQLAVCAGRLAYDDAGLTAEDVDPEGIALFLGVGLEYRSLADFGATLAESRCPETGDFQAGELHQRGIPVQDPYVMLRALSNLAAAHLSIELGIMGPNAVISPSATAGGQAIGEAYFAVRSGEVDVALAGATDARCNFFALQTLASLGMLCLRGSPESPPAGPFGEGANGIVPGEGSVVLVVEGLEHGLRRGATIYGRLRGYSECSSPVESHASSTTGFERSMAMALREAGIGIDALDLLHPEASGHAGAELAEAAAIRQLFRGDLPDLVSIKPLTGHLMAAAQPAEVAALLLMLQDQLTPEFPLGGQPRKELGFDPRRRTRSPPFETAMSNSYGWGGNYVSIVVDRASA